jgi:UDP-2-acetamido-2-deoxy-ribo-hexuluronate aminotransferase
LVSQQERIREKIEKNVKAVLDHGQYVLGPEVKALEECLAAYVGVKHAISCSSGTDALLIALMAHGVGSGDAVFTTPFTFIATAEVISLLGAVPVFVDIDPKTYNISPRELEKAVLALTTNDPSIYPLPRFDGSAGRVPHTLRARGVVGVDLYGLPANYDRINAIADDHGLFVIEDGAQSFGGESGERKVGSLAEIGCTSFYPAKPLGCYGDGGMCFTDDDALADRMRSISLHGQGRDRYESIRIGINGRLDTLQAAVLLAKFDVFPEEIEARRKVAQGYTELFASSPFITPRTPDGYRSAWGQYSLLAESAGQRADAQNRLKEAGIPTARYYPIPLHLQTAFASLDYRTGNFPVSECSSERIFSLPMHPYLKGHELRLIAQTLLDTSTEKGVHSAPCQRFSK